MEKRKEFIKLRKIIDEMVSWWWPGYPFSLYGCIDFKTQDCYLTSDKTFNVGNNFEKFVEKFDSKLLYHILDCKYVRKGSWLVNQYMPQYKQILEDDPLNRDTSLDEKFFIDNYELARLYFTVYAAIKEFKDTDKLLFFEYDGDAECVCVEVFNNLDEINNYYKNYIKGE